MLGQSGSGSDDNEGVHCNPKSSSITGASPSDYLVSNPGHSLGGYLSAKVQSVYSTALADWAIHRFKCQISFISGNSVYHKYTL